MADTDVLEAAAWTFFSERVEYIVAVMAAPDAALTAAMRAIVVFDMPKKDRAQRSPHQMGKVAFLYWKWKYVLVIFETLLEDFGAHETAW